MSSKDKLESQIVQIGQAMQGIGGERVGTGDISGVPDGIANLRNLSKEADDPEDRFHAYLLWAFLYDLWNNYAMAPSTQIEDEKIVSDFVSIGTMIEQMGERRSSSDVEGFFNRFAQAYNTYVRWVESINKDL